MSLDTDPASSLLRVERPASGGAVARAGDGRVTFVRHALPGELVRVAITDTTAHFYRADATEIVEASPERVSAPCPYAHAGGCGGCDLQHASSSAQRAWKSDVVAEQLRRVAGVETTFEFVSPPSGARGSRTRLRVGVDDEGALGLRAARSHDLVTLSDCWLADERLAPAFERRWPGVKELELRALGAGEPFAVARRHDGAVDVRSLEGHALNPSTSSRVVVGEYAFTVSPLSFWQAHRDGPAMLTESVLDQSGVNPGDEVVDLYSGVGLFAVPLAQRVGVHGRVSAVESSAHAVRNARENGAAFRQLRVREWSVTARSVNDTVREGSVVVLDPPRAGLAKGVAAALVRQAPRRVVYVSCDAATFARDLTIFLRGGYSLERLRVMDLFPMTEHVELVATLDSPT